VNGQNAISFVSGGKMEESLWKIAQKLTLEGFRARFRGLAAL